MATKKDLASSYPKTVQLPKGQGASFRLMTAADRDEVLEFARSLPPDDLLFLRTDITDPATIKDWISNIGKGTTVTVLAEVDGDLAGYGSVHLSEARWTKGVGEIRINVGSRWRGISLGRRLTSEIFDIAREMGLRKITAQMTPDQVGARAVFERLGFRVEAFLADWVEDRNGQTRDLLMMTYDLLGLTDDVHAS